MDQTSNDPYAGGASYGSAESDLGQDIEFDFDDEDFDEDSDLVRVLGIAGGVAAAIAGLIILLGRRRRTPAEELAAQASATVDDLRTTLEKADLRGKLGDALDQVNARVREVDVRDLARRASGVNLDDAVSEIQQRLSTIEREGRRGARRAQKEAHRAFRNLDLGDLSDDLRGQLTDLWGEISDRAQDVGWQQAIDESRR